MTICSVIWIAGSCSASSIGDLNRDGSISVADAMLSIRFLLALQDPIEDQEMLADTNGDGSLNVLDVIAIIQAATGMIPNTPVEPPSHFWVSHYNSTQMACVWRDNSLDEDCFWISVSPDQAFPVSNTVNYRVPKDTSFYQVQHLQPLTIYFFRIKAQRGFFEGVCEGNYYKKTYPPPGQWTKALVGEFGF